MARFKAALAQLWDRLLSEAQDVEPEEEDLAASVDGPPPGRMASLLAAILPFLASFSGSNVRALRAGSTACGLSLGSGLVSCAVRAASSRDTAQRQVQAAGGTGARSAAAKAALAAAQAAVSACEAALKDVYTQVFTLRFRDTEASIRADCISSMGAWITGYPAFFLKDYYLKYLGWALNDKAPAVRLAAVTSISSAYTTAERAAAMSTFVGRFAPRLVDMAKGDVDDAVASACVRLLGALHEHGTLPADGSAAVLGALLDDSPLMRSAAAEVVPALLGDTSPSQGSAGAGHHITGVLRILGAGPDRPHAADAAVEALWDKLPALKDWDALLAAAAGTGASSSPADERATTDGVRLLAAVCRKLAAAPEVFTGGAAKGGVKGTKAAKDAASKERGQLSTQLMGALPRLLAAHGAHAQRAGELGDCVMAMSLELYALKRNEPGFDTLLTALTGALFKQTAGTPLAAVARALAFCALKGPSALQATAQKHADGAIDKLATRLKKLLPKPRGGGPGGGSGDSAVETAVALSRLRALQEAGLDVRHTGLSSQLGALLDSPAWCASLGDGVTSLAASNAAHMVLFSLADFGDGSSAGDDVADAVAGDITSAAAALKAQRDALVDQAVALFRSGGSPQLKRTSFALLCDLAWVFSAKRLATAGGAAAGPASTASALASLGWTPPADLLEELWRCALAALPESGATAASQALFSQDVGGGAAAHGDDMDDDDDTTTHEGGGLSGSPSGGVSIVPSDKLRSTHMLACVSRLVLYGLLPSAQAEWLSGRLMSLWAGHGPVAAELAKRASTHAKRFTTLASYERAALGALQASFERHCEDENSAESGASLRDTAAKVASSFGSGGHAMPLSARASLCRVTEAGVTWALSGEEPTSRLPFLTAALPPFVAKLTTDHKAQVASLLASAGGDAADEADEAWAPFFALTQLLSSSPSGGAAGGPAKKRGRAAGKKKARRAGAWGSDDEEAPSDEVEDDSDGDDVEPARGAAKPATRLPRGGRGGAAAAPVPGPDGWVPFRSGGAAAKSPSAGRARAAPPPVEEEEAMEEDGIEEGGDEEEEPAPAPGRAQTYGRRKRREPLFLGDDEEEGGAGGGGSDSEELPQGVVPPAAKKVRR